MRCDYCGQTTEKNYFTADNFTVLCKDCATANGFYGGKDAKEYINQKTKE